MNNLDVIFSNQCPDKKLTDSWTFIHINNAFILFLLFNVFFTRKITIFGTILVFVGWEVYENSNIGINLWNKNLGYSNYRGDSVINIIGDIISGLIGCYIGYRASFVELKYRIIFIPLFFIFMEIIPYYLSQESIVIICLKYINSYNP